MIRINLGEMNELALFSQTIRYKENIEEEIKLKKEGKKAINSNETAKREIASELMLQGFSDESICRILNISTDQLPESISF